MNGGAGLVLSDTPGRGEPGSAARRELAELIHAAGIIRSDGDQPVFDRSGKRGAWGLYTPNVSLTHRGLRLAGEELLAKLATFRATQLASSGWTATPLLSACVLLGEGRYSGLSIRDKPKSYLTRRRIDGPADPQVPVVVVDDSISSGTSLFRSIEALEMEGLTVEGAVALVCFPYRGGAERAYEHGYRVEWIFDAWEDLGMSRRGLIPAPKAPTSRAQGSAVEPGLPPATAARRIAEIYLSEGLVPQSPECFDREYDGSGGVFVSFRKRASEHRVARDGFWHFVPGTARPCDDLVAATVKTLRAAAETVSLTTLPRLKVAVTFFGELERVAPAELDFAKYAIVVRDSVLGRKIGGALPNTQVFVCEMGQYNHARRRNARLTDAEPHELYRHTLTKHIEPGDTWLPYGAEDGPELQWTNDRSIGQELVDRARSVVDAASGSLLPGRALADTLVPYPIYGCAVGLYRRGLMASGLALATQPGALPLDALVRDAARRAAAELATRLCGSHRAEVPGLEPAGLEKSWSIVVTLLHDPERLGRSTSVATSKLRRGLDAVVAEQNGRRVVALPSAIPYSGLSRQEFIATMSVEASGTGTGAEWRTYRTSAWLGGDARVVRPMRFGFPLHDRDEPDYTSMTQGLAQHIVAGLDELGLPTYHLDAVRGKATRTGTSARLISALLALDEAGRRYRRDDWIDAARPGLIHSLDYVGRDGVPGAVALPGQRNGILADCVLLEAATALGSTIADHPSVPPLLARVIELFRPDGRIGLKPVKLGIRQDHDFLPGAALLALATAAHSGKVALANPTLEACLRWQRGRFRVLRTWGMAGWQPQGWAAAWRVTRDPDQAKFVFEIADWAVERQVTKTGAFLEDLAYTEPTFNTGFIAQAVAAAWRVADEYGDRDRRARYQCSWERAMSFLAALMISPEDTFCMEDPDRALGGVRTSITRSDVRIDAVSHALRALSAGNACLTRDELVA
jgi:orotate phosphoribosyltransferase/AMMECR1 domain-containing protein